MKNSLVRILVTIGSIISIGFGLWHFFVPNIWNWYSYIVPEATELVIAVRAINFLFSLLLILLGVANILCVIKLKKDKFQTITIISISMILWAARVILQIVYPQGSQNQIIQYSMLVIFSIVLACFAISLLLILTQKEIIET